MGERMHRFLRLVALWTIALGVGTIAAAAPRAPTGKWVVDYNRQCLATRSYGSVEEPLYLALKPAPQGQLMQVIVFLKSGHRKTAVEAPVTIRIDGLAAMQSRMLAFTAKNALRTLLVNVPIETFAPMRQAFTVSIQAYGEIEESFALTQMPSLMVELDRCMVDLAHFWNLDDPGKAKLRSHATGDLKRFLNDGDYPDAALRKDEGGTVAFAFLIDESGKVADCMVTATSNVPILDAEACAILMERARFTPAVGADGKPARDGATGRILWNIRP